MQNLMETGINTGLDFVPESEVVQGGSAKRLNATQIQATAWTFHREWEFRIPGDEYVRKIAEFILEEDVRMSMPATLGVTYLVVLLNVFISTWYGTRLHRNKGIYTVLEKRRRLCTEKIVS
jgi:hypothetical protein